MGDVRADGKVLWLSGRFDNVVYAIDTYGRGQDHSGRATASWRSAGRVTAYICSYATKWMKDPFKFTREDTDEFYDRMIQTAAIAAAAAESVVRQRDMKGKTFYEPPTP